MTVNGQVQAGTRLSTLPVELIMLIIEYLHHTDIYSLLFVESRHNPPSTTDTSSSKVYSRYLLREACITHNVKFGELTILYKAFHHDDAETVKELLSTALMIVHDSSERKTILSLAPDHLWFNVLITGVRHRSIFAIQELLSFRDIRCLLEDCKYLQHALFIAAETGDTPLMKLLIDSGANPERTDSLDLTPLLIAVSARRFEAAKLLLARYNVNCNAKDSYGCTALYYAAQSCDFLLVKLLLVYGADPDLQNDDGYTPLAIAAELGEIEIVRLLLAHDANPSIARGIYHGALGVAARAGRAELVRLLLDDRRVDPNATAFLGFTALMEAVNARHFETVEVLINSPRVDPNIRNRFEETPLHLALIRDSTFKIAEILLDSPRIKVDEKDNFKVTPLMMAVSCSSGSPHRPNAIAFTERMLATKQIDLNARSACGNTPLTFAIRSGCRDFVELLLDTGHLTVTDHDLAIASGMNNVAIHKLLRKSRKGKSIKAISSRSRW